MHLDILFKKSAKNFINKLTKRIAIAQKRTMKYS